MENEILGDTDLETIINNFECKKYFSYLTFFKNHTLTE